MSVYKIVKKDTPEAKEIAKAIYKNDGFCCCAVTRCEDTICMCKDFRDKCKDPEFYGECHCGLYEKVKGEQSK